MNAAPARGTEAAAVAVVLTLVLMVVTAVQQRVVLKRKFTTVSGKGMKPRVLAIGRWRTIGLVLAVAYLLLALVLPALALLLASLQSSPYLSSLGQLTTAGGLSFWSLGHTAIDPEFLHALRNSLLVAVVAATVGTTLSFVVGYTVYRTTSPGRKVLEYVAMAPLAVPAIVMGLGLLWTWVAAPVPVYGTVAVLVIAFVGIYLPQGYRGTTASILQVDDDLEDSAVPPRSPPLPGRPHGDRAAHEDGAAVHAPAAAHAVDARTVRRPVPLHLRHPVAVDRGLRRVRQRCAARRGVHQPPVLPRDHGRRAAGPTARGPSHQGSTLMSSTTPSPSRRAVLAAGTLSAAGLGLAACAPPPSYQLVNPASSVDTANGLVVDGELIADAALFSAAKAEGSLSLYTGYVENSEKEVVRAFTADTGIAVDMIRLVPNRLLERVLSEQGAGRLRADVVRSSDPANVLRMQEAGVFAPHVVPGYDELDDTVRYADGSYYRCFDPAFTFGYNTALVEEDEVPTSWQDLVDPRWKGGSASPRPVRAAVRSRSPGSSSRSSAGLAEGAGRERAARVRQLRSHAGEPGPREIHASTAVVSSLNIAMAKNAPVQFVVPDEGFALYDYFAGVPRGGPAPQRRAGLPQLEHEPARGWRLRRHRRVLDEPRRRPAHGARDHPAHRGHGSAAPTRPRRPGRAPGLRPGVLERGVRLRRLTPQAPGTARAAAPARRTPTTGG